MYNKQIEGFTLFKKKPNAINYGSLYVKKIVIPCSFEKKRTLRVWLPEDYNGKKTFEVIYMSDGQNMVDKYTTAYGEWNMEDHIHNLQKKGLAGYILVGIDCCYDSKRRMEEYSPYNIEKEINKEPIKDFHAYGKEFAEYIVNNIKPLIDKTFKTIPERSGFIGSSMGGLFSFYISTTYPNIFKFALCYSSALCLYKKRTIKKWYKQWNPKPDNCPKLFIYSGAKDKFERNFVNCSKYLYKYLKKKGFNDNQVSLLIDKNAPHNEAAWSTHVEESLLFINKK